MSGRLGFRYRLTDSQLDQELPEFGDFSRQSALLHEASLSLDWNSASGLFGRLEGNYYHQELDGSDRCKRCFALKAEIHFGRRI